MPESVITPIASGESCRTFGSKAQITGRARSPRKAVKTISTAVSLCRKYLSTRYLSMWVESAHISGPEKANNSHIFVTPPASAILLGAFRRKGASVLLWPPPFLRADARGGEAGRSLLLLLRNQH